MREFHWLTASRIPPAHDLRRCGWALLPGPPGEDEPACPVLAYRPTMGTVDWMRLLRQEDGCARDRTLLIGVNDAAERGRLLRLGFGDAVHDKIALEETEVRAGRIAERQGLLPRVRELGGLKLDLLAREGYCGERPLGLHPREFALLWRLADTPGRPVGKRELVFEVWRKAFVPDTNSIAVHVSRLRSKLAHFGLEGLVQTVPAGGYRLASAAVPAASVAPEARRGIFNRAK